MSTGRVASFCLVGLRIISLSVLTVVVLVGLFVIVGNVSEAVAGVFVWTAVSLSVVGFIVAFMSKHVLASSAEMNKPLLRLVYMEGILTVIVVQVADGYSWVPQRFIFNLGAVIAFQAILLFSGLVIHIWNNRRSYPPSNILLGALVPVAFIALSLWILNASRTVDSIGHGLVSFFIIIAQTVVVTIQFGMRSTPRYCCVTTLLVLVITVYAIGGAYLFHIGGGF